MVARLSHTLAQALDSAVSGSKRRKCKSRPRAENVCRVSLSWSAQINCQRNETKRNETKQTHSLIGRLLIRAGSWSSVAVDLRFRFRFRLSFATCDSRFDWRLEFANRQSSHSKQNLLRH